jgi:hypothetical protein
MVRMSLLLLVQCTGAPCLSFIDRVHLSIGGSIDSLITHWLIDTIHSFTCLSYYISICTYYYSSVESMSVFPPSYYYPCILISCWYITFLLVEMTLNPNDKQLTNNSVAPNWTTDNEGQYHLNGVSTMQHHQTCISRPYQVFLFRC